MLRTYLEAENISRHPYENIHKSQLIMRHSTHNFQLAALLDEASQFLFKNGITLSMDSDIYGIPTSTRVPFGDGRVAQIYC